MKKLIIDEQAYLKEFERQLQPVLLRLDKLGLNGKAYLMWFDMRDEVSDKDGTFYTKPNGIDCLCVLCFNIIKANGDILDDYMFYLIDNDHDKITKQSTHIKIIHKDIKRIEKKGIDYYERFTDKRAKKLLKRYKFIGFISKHPKLTILIIISAALLITLIDFLLRMYA